MSRMGRRATLLFLVITLGCSCASKTFVALVPDSEGKTGSLTVSDEAGSVAIDTPYRATTVGKGTKPPEAPKDVGREALERRFAAALSVEPPRPLHFFLYFHENTTLFPESLRLLPTIVLAIRERRSGYISVIGHADTIGTNDYNMDMSRERAVVVKELLVKKGVESGIIWIDWHGEEDLVVPTADEVWERRNRVVDVVVR